MSLCILTWEDLVIHCRKEACISHSNKSFVDARLNQQSRVLCGGRAHCLPGAEDIVPERGNRVCLEYTF